MLPKNLRDSAEMKEERKKRRKMLKLNIKPKEPSANFYEYAKEK